MAGMQQLSKQIAIGTMQWGDSWLDETLVNKGGGSIPDDTLDDILKVLVKGGVQFLDTAEGYGGGTSERRIGEMMARNPEAQGRLFVASKFLPTVWRWTEQSLIDAVKGMNKRLNVETQDLLFIHSPVHPLPLEHWVRAACKAVDLGLVKRIGLSNCNANQVARAVAAAKAQGKRICANQVLFSLLDYNSPALQDMLKVCAAEDIKIVGFSPIGQGLLTEGLTEEGMKGIRMAMMTGLRWGDGGLNTLRSEIEMIAKRCKRSMAQVCIKWSIHKGAIPLVGVRRTKHAEDAVAAASNEWDLSAEEIQRLDVAALDRSTLEKPAWRRGLFMCVLSTLLMVYSVTEMFLGKPRVAQIAAGKKTKSKAG